MDGTVLLADDDSTIRTVLTQALTRAGCKVHATASLQTLMRWIDEGRGDLVISDVMMPDGNGLEHLPRIRASRPALPVIIISAQNTILTAIRAAEGNAFDYLPKPFDLPDLMQRCGAALGQKRHADVVAPARVVMAEDLPLLGRAPIMQELYRLIAKVMNGALPVLLQGESGTGKTLIAQAMHDFSARSQNGMLVLRPADDLFAARHQINAFRSGTLLVESLPDFDAAQQLQLLHLIEGFDGAILSTSQSDLELTGFRKDLFYRLSGTVLHIPPLHDRIEDIPLLATHFLNKSAQGGGGQHVLSPEAQSFLRRQIWPGNLRQLEAVICRIALGGARVITEQDVQHAYGAASPKAALHTDPQTENLSQSIKRHLRRYFDLHEGALPPEGVYQRILQEMELPLLEIALEATAGNQAQCATLLGLNRNTLRKKLTELGITPIRMRKLM